MQRLDGDEAAAVPWARVGHLVSRFVGVLSVCVEGGARVSFFFASGTRVRELVGFGV